MLRDTSQNDSAIFMLLLFPLIGICSLFYGWNMRKRFLHFGLTPLTPMPQVGQVGGQVGGRIELNQNYLQHDLLVTLNCMNKYTTRTGSSSTDSHGSRNTVHYRVLWKEEIKPLYHQSSTGSSIDFCFDVPAGQYTKDTYKGEGTVYWEVCVEGRMDGVKFDRAWEVPVKEGTGLSSIVITDRHKESSENAIHKQAEASVDQQIDTKKTFNGLNIISEQGRNQTSSSLVLLMGAVFLMIGFFTFDKNEPGLILFGTVFPLVGCIILCYGIFLIGRELECKISGTTVRTQRRVFGRLMSTKEGKLTSSEQLSLEVTMSSSNNGKLTETMALYANVTAPVSQKLKLAEGIQGRKAGEAMKRKVEKALLEQKRFH